MSRSVGRDVPGASDEAVGVRPATERAVRADMHQQLPVYSQNEDLCKGHGVGEQTMRRVLPSAEIPNASTICPATRVANSVSLPLGLAKALKSEFCMRSSSTHEFAVDPTGEE